MFQVHQVTRTYQMGDVQVHALRGVDLELFDREFVVLLGASGSGKSTLLNILGGLDVPTSGSVRYLDQDLAANDPSQLTRFRRDAVGFVFQFYHLFPGFTALENVLFPMMVKEDTVGVKKFESKGLDLLDQFGLIERIKHKPNELSGGEQQRVAIARAVINDPQILFCDEPTGNLDSENGSEVIRLLLDLNKRNKQTLIIVTHDEELAELCHRTVHIRDGAIMQS